MQPNNNDPHQPPVSPVQPAQPLQVPPVQPLLPDPQMPPSPAPGAGGLPRQPYQQPDSQWSQPSFYGTSAYQQAPPPTPTNIAPPPPTEAPLALTAPMWIREHWLILVASFVGVVLLLTVVFQIIWPSNRLLPGTVVDGVKLDYMRKQDAVDQLNKAYGQLKLSIYFGSNQAAFQSPKFADVGIGVDTTDRLSPLSYPWYLRIIPSSFFWAAGLSKPGELSYVYDKSKIDSYIQAQVGDDCTIPAKDASLKLVGDKLQLIPAQPGGVCDITRFQEVLASTKPSADGNNKVTIDIRETAALVDDEKARLLMNALNDRAATPMPIAVIGGNQTIAGKSVLSWLDFKSFIPETPAGQPRDDDRVRNGSKLTFTVNRDRMAAFMAGDIAKKVAIKAGVNKVATTDFTETSRVNGQVGRELDNDATAVTVENYLNKKADQASAQTHPIQPSTTYTRTYNPTSTGFSAMLAQWPQEHAGTWAMSFTEVSGTKPYRAASYRGDQQMLAAGTEAGYVGYAELFAEQSGAILGTDQIAGRSPSQCFKDMIEKTDLDCIAAFITKIGHETMVARGNELGLKGTTFTVDSTKTTTADLTTLLNLAYTTKLAPSANGGRILSTMQSTRLRDGIAAGLAKGTAANLAGQSGKVQNDAAIVYSPKGVYLLVVMTDGGSRSDIAALTQKIETLHQILPPKVDR